MAEVAFVGEVGLCIVPEFERQQALRDSLRAPLSRGFACQYNTQAIHAGHHTSDQSWYIHFMATQIHPTRTAPSAPPLVGLAHSAYRDPKDEEKSLLVELRGLSQKGPPLATSGRRTPERRFGELDPAGHRATVAGVARTVLAARSDAPIAGLNTRYCASGAIGGTQTSAPSGAHTSKAIRTWIAPDAPKDKFSAMLDVGFSCMARNAAAWTLLGCSLEFSSTA
ncbi:hypothetical protein FIBSPDRAFT_898175 [Athelia psychrophila]|uniref:Uncharacterized protein n=1 Tax=Athelia psychrophila TaxID=1759441 RepID=A0A166B9E6_9AGAM|nr:hypothetical protein FIBSPDRAFT_898175 [Fibularhizoctonia sp. CBS 109695]